jgi:hypothetical protein
VTVPTVSVTMPAFCYLSRRDDLVAGAERSLAVGFRRRAVEVRRECVLQTGVEVAGSGGSAVHRREHLGIAARVQVEFGGDEVGDDVNDEFGVSAAGCRRESLSLGRK